MASKTGLQNEEFVKLWHVNTKQFRWTEINDPFYISFDHFGMKFEWKINKKVNNIK